MTTKIIVLTEESGGSREDGNVYYARYLLVSSDTLNFDEAVFTTEEIDTDDIDEFEGDDDDHNEAVIAHIRALGYIVEEPESQVLTISI